MNIIDKFTYIYTSTANFSAVFRILKIDLIIRFFLRAVSNIFFPLYLKRKLEDNRIIATNVIISMTSFPARISKVWMVVQTLKRQSYIPEKIILWLSQQQFPTKESIPSKLWNEVDELFEIRFVSEDIRSHKKYYYAMKDFPLKTIVTCDDDIFYHSQMLKSLLDVNNDNSCIVSNICSQLSYDENDNLKPFMNWNIIVESYSRINNVQIGAGGVLYPPHSLDEMVLRKDLFMKLTPLADDLWLNCMARILKTPIIKSGLNIIPLPIVIKGAPTLESVNCGENKNDEQIINLRKYLREIGSADVYSIEYKC